MALSMSFRGSIAWLDGSLSTLQSTRSPRHDARLASDCAATLCRVGFAPTGFVVKSFNAVFSSHRILLSRAYLAQSPFGVLASKAAAEWRKGIQSIEKQIAEHRDKIANPEKFIPDFKELDPRQQKALLERKWPSDIRRQQQQLDILKGLLEGE